MFGLDHLLAPQDAGAFLSEHWGRRALRVPGTAEKFPGLFGWADVNHALEHGRLRHPDIMLALDKQKLPPEALDRLDEWLRKGATLILNRVQTMDPVVGRFASSLAGELNTPVNVNCYVSWPSRQGFDMHFDRHHVFVVQVAGRKAWKVFEPTRRWPVEQEPLVRTEPPAGMIPYLECALDPGDVLYIPRGHWHYAVAETPSIHLTAGPVPRTGVDFLAWLTRHLVDTDEVVREDLPLPRAAALGGDRPAAELAGQWDRLRAHLTARLQEDALLDGFLQHCMTENRPPRAWQLPDLVTLDERLSLETRFLLAPDQKALLRYDEASRTATATMRGRIVRLENVPERLVTAFFSAGAVVQGTELLAACPDLRAEDVERLLRRMFVEGILVLADGGDG